MSSRRPRVGEVADANPSPADCVGLTDADRRFLDYLAEMALRIAVKEKKMTQFMDDADHKDRP